MAITSKEINLIQLDQELGGQGLSADFNDPNNKIIVPSDNSTVTETELETAIEAHIAGPTQEEVKVLNRQQGIVKLNELGFTNEQITALLEITEEEIVTALAAQQTPATTSEPVVEEPVVEPTPEPVIEPVVEEPVVTEE